jgi:2-dehydropantoate 2-reductase
MTNDLMADDYARSLVEQLMHEVVAGAATCDRFIPDSFIGRMLDHTAKMKKPYRTSMKIDYDSKRSLEVEAIFGNPLRMAQAAGADLPQISMLYQQLKFLDAKNCG